MSKELMIPTPLPEHLWEKVGTNVFEINGKHYIVVADYYSRYPEVTRLTSTKFPSIITAMKSVLSQHTVVSDNGPQYDPR